MCHLDNIDITKKQIEEFDGKIAQLCEDDEMAKILLIMPGISFTTAAVIISEIADIKRFSTPAKLVAYAGLAPSHRDSANVHKGGSITKRGSTWLRNALVESATTTVRLNDRIKSFYTRIAKRHGKQKARVSAARQMLEIIWYMLNDMKEYRTQNTDLTSRKFKKMKKKAQLS